VDRAVRDLLERDTQYRSGTLLETGHFNPSQGLLERYNQYRLGTFWRGPLCTVQVRSFLKRGTYSSQVRVPLERDIQYR